MRVVAPLEVTGTGYAPEGRLDAQGDILTVADPDALVAALTA